MAEITIRISDKILKMLAVIAAVLMLTSVGSAIWKSDLLAPVYRLQIHVPESGGLTAGSQVRLNGMPIGTVDSVNPAAAPTTSLQMVQVTLRVQKRYQEYIRSGSTASIGSLGLLGNHFVDIHRSTIGIPIQAGGEVTFEPTHEPTPKEFIDALGALGKRSNCSDAEKHEAKETPPTHQ
jgi:ABC-type transporter Mla subunit MlaD